MNLLHDKQLFINVPFKSTKNRKKELCVDSKVQDSIGVVCFPTCRSENSVYLSTNKTSSFYDCKKCKTCCHVWNISFKDPKTDNFVVWRGWHTILRQKDESWLRKLITISSFDETSPQITKNHTRTWAKSSQKSFHLWCNCVDLPLVLIQLTRISFPISFYVLSVYSKAKWFSQCPTTVLSFFLTLDQIRLLWLQQTSSKKWQ